MRIAVVGRVQWAGVIRFGYSRSVEIHDVGLGVRERIFEARLFVSNQKNVSAELQRMISVCPVQAVAELVDGHNVDERASEGSNTVNSVQNDLRLQRGAGVLARLADPAPVKIVDQGRGEQRSESDGGPLTIIQQSIGCGLAGKLLGLRLLVILRLTAPKKIFRAILSDVVINPGNVCVEARIRVG